jgi:hypothetical protein
VSSVEVGSPCDAAHIDGSKNQKGEGKQQRYEFNI